MRPLYVLILFLTLSAVSPAQTTWYVPDDFPTGIQDAINSASVIKGDTIIVRPGTYKENIDFLGKAITVKSDQGPAVTVIDGKYTDPTARFTSREGPDSILNGFTLKGGKRGGASCENASPTITNNIITGNGAYYPNGGGGIACQDASPIITNNLIYYNSINGISCFSSSPIITNNTVFGSGQTGIYCDSNSTPIITNTIVWAHPNLAIEGDLPVVTYCDVERGYPGTGNIDSDPCLLCIAEGDLHIASYSPCKDGGDNTAPALPAEDFDGENRIHNGTVDMGADECWANHAPPGILYVPGNHGTIQQAIDAALPLETVEVMPGTYVENIDFKGKSITVKSSEGAAKTVIDGGIPLDPDHASVVSFRNRERSLSMLHGFTLTKGKGTDYDHWMTMGGGIFCTTDCSPTITNNVIQGNEASEGAGIYCYKSSPFIAQNVIRSNGTALSYGGGISCDDSSPSIMNNKISSNTAYWGGGIACFHYSCPTITGNIIARNVVTMAGGIFCSNYSTPAITNNIIHGNTAATKAGGIFLEVSAPAITNNTIFNNSAEEGGGIWCQTSVTKPVITNTILWNNSATEGPNIWMGYDISPSTVTISYSNMQGGPSSVHVGPNCTLNWGAGMIDAAPLFVDPPQGDFHLAHTSPCLDTGDNNAVADAEDFEGDPRTALGTVDMGADEFHPHLYIMGDKTPGGAVQVKLIGVPGSSPTAFFIGTAIWEPPLSWWPYGLWYLKPPALGPFMLGPIPSPEGIHMLSGMLPLSPPAPYTLYFHGIIGSVSTNLETLVVQ